MSETKRNVPKLRFPGFTEDWEQRKLGDVVERVSCTSEDSEIPQVEYEDIISGEGRLNKDITKKLSNKKGILFRKGDVLYGKLRPYLKNWLLPEFSGKAVGDFWVLRSEKVQSSFLYNLIQSNRFELASNQSTGTKMPRADWNLVANTEFLIPASIEEQISIGKIFKLLNDSITLHQRKLENLKLKKKALLQKLFPKNGEQFPELRFPGFTDAWEQRKLGDVVERVSCTSEDSEIPQVEYEDIISGEGRLNKDITKKLSNKKGILFRKGDVLYGKLRPYLKNWLLPEFSGKAVGDFWVLRSEKVQSSFLYNLIQSNRFELASNQSTGTKMPRADWNLVANTEFLIPASIEEQISIGKIFKLLNDSITLHQRKLEHLQLQKKALLQQMFV